jgi:hypothetical protein
MNNTRLILEPRILEATRVYPESQTLAGVIFEIRDACMKQVYRIKLTDAQIKELAQHIPESK